MDIVIGVVVLVSGLALSGWGGHRLVGPRREGDVEWIERNPLSNWMLGGALFGFDREGALFSLLAGVFAIVIGLSVLVAL